MTSTLDTAHAAREPVAPQVHGGEDEAPESRVGRRRVLVTLHREMPAGASIAMGRHIAGALQASLHGLLFAPEPIDAADVAEHVGLPQEDLRGLVLHVATGDPGEALSGALTTQAAAYVVVGSAPLAAPEEQLGLGELAERALEVANCGVFLVGAAAPRARLHRILLPLDGTPSTAAAITPAGHLARSLEADLDILLVGEVHPHAVAPPDREPGALVAPVYMDQPHHEWAAFSEEFLQRFVGNIGHCPREVPARFYLGAGEPAPEILRFAGQLRSDLLVLVWHGDLSEHHGTVFREVVRNAPCPVLVLRR